MFALMSRLQVWATGAQSCWRPLEGDVEYMTGLSYPRGKEARIFIYKLLFVIDGGAKYTLLARESLL